VLVAGSAIFNDSERVIAAMERMRAAAIIAVDARGAVPSQGRFIMAVSGGRKTGS
jgi:hypothetical protein